jgi:hypothetical protein
VKLRRRRIGLAGIAIVLVLIFIFAVHKSSPLNPNISKPVTVAQLHKQLNKPIPSAPNKPSTVGAGTRTNSESSPQPINSSRATASLPNTGPTQTILLFVISVLIGIVLYQGWIRQRLAGEHANSSHRMHR